MYTLAACSIISAGVQDLLAPFFQHIYCTIIEKKTSSGLIEFLLNFSGLLLVFSLLVYAEIYTGIQISIQ